MSKYSVLPLISDQLKTLRDDRTQRTRWVDVVTLIGAPALLAALAALRDFRVQGIGEIVGGLAILAGFLFALVIFVFQLRLAVTNDPRVPARGKLPRLIDELFANVNYAVLIGLLTTGVAIAAASTRAADDAGDLEPVNRWWTAVLVFLFVHLMLLLGMALRRTRVAYREMRH